SDRAFRLSLTDRSQANRWIEAKSLRHFYASKLIRAGESVAVVQARLGHASPMVTLGTYTHLWEDAADTTRAAVDGLF
ncbi:tyrosine-type recombinase/integrase, partial [Gordonia sp. i37]|uniref:tyrosine-type recombinase/integrase n=1 Tax=Gordonia sp. i37 TaxID=1961707 RepID=UPI0009C71F93